MVVMKFSIHTGVHHIIYSSTVVHGHHSVFYLSDSSGWIKRGRDANQSYWCVLLGVDTTAVLWERVYRAGIRDNICSQRTRPLLPSTNMGQ